MSQVAVIIPAAGASTRFGGPIKKPFLTLAGKPVWQRSVELFCHRPDVAVVLLVLGPADLPAFRERHGIFLGLLFGNVELVEGGAERSESVANALARVPAGVELVAVHDAVRPLTPNAVIDAVFAAARRHGAAMPAVPVADTLKRVDPATGFITDTVSRANLYAAQTPQAFRRDWLAAAYAGRANHPGAITDDAQLIEAAGHRVMVVPGAGRNFKLTTAEDFALAEFLLADPPRPAEKPAARPFADEDDGRGD